MHPDPLSPLSSRPKGEILFPCSAVIQNSVLCPRNSPPLNRPLFRRVKWKMGRTKAYDLLRMKPRTRILMTGDILLLVFR